MSQLQIEFDICVICGKPSHEPKNKHIDFRTGYVEGSGQVCLDCHHGKTSKKEFINSNIFYIEESLILENPNDSDLGKKIRQEYWKNKEKIKSSNKELSDKRIFESPDGGKTVYERPFGSSPSQRKIVENK